MKLGQFRLRISTTEAAYQQLSLRSQMAPVNLFRCFETSMRRRPWQIRLRRQGASGYLSAWVQNRPVPPAGCYPNWDTQYFKLGRNDSSWGFLVPQLSAILSPKAKPPTGLHFAQCPAGGLKRPQMPPTEAVLLGKRGRQLRAGLLWRIQVTVDPASRARFHWVRAYCDHISMIAVCARKGAIDVPLGAGHDPRQIHSSLAPPTAGPFDQGQRWFCEISQRHVMLLCVKRRERNTLSHR